MNDTLVRHPEPPLQSEVELQAGVRLLAAVIHFHLSFSCVPQDLKYVLTMRLINVTKVYIFYLIKAL